MIIISPSSMSSWTDCPRRELARRYPELIPPRYNLRKRKSRIGGARGTIAHNVIAKLLRRKKETGNYSIPDDIDLLVTESIDEEMKKGKVNFFQTVWDQINTGPDDVRRSVKAIALAFASKILPTVHPEFIEQKFSAPLFPGVIVEGTPDYTSLLDNRRTLKDNKTGKDSPFQLQMGMYSLLLDAAGFPADEIEVDRIEAVAPDKPGKPIQTTKLNVELCKQEAYSEAKLIWRDVNEFKRTKDLNSLTGNLNSNLCNKTDCPLWGGNGCPIATNGEMIND